jgi:AraC-like DNA-binding protein
MCYRQIAVNGPLACVERLRLYFSDALTRVVLPCCDDPMLLTHQPTGPLASYVEKLWYCDGVEVVHRIKRVLPNGRFQLFVSLSDTPLQGPGGTMSESGQRASSLVVGMRSRFSVLDTSKLQSAMGVLFWPGGARAFFDAPADMFHNESVPLELFWGPLAGQIRDHLLDASTPAEKFQALESGLLDRQNKTTALHVSVRYALGEFARKPHIHSVIDVAKEAGLSRRRFAQLFREQVGLTPKLYCRLRRFQGVLRQIAAGSPVDWAGLALAGGYCDQAHLANEFRSFSGISPNVYLATERPMPDGLPLD